MSINRYLRPSRTVNILDNDTEGTVILRDYTHAKKIFIDNDYKLSPKYNFLFYVEFDLNPAVSNVSTLSAQQMGMIVKSVNLPKFTIGVKEHNAYNRKNYVQNNIKYDPVTIKFHDDQSDLIRNFWYDYYSYYYRDPDYADATYQIPTKYNTRATFNWGYTPRANAGAAGASSDNFQEYQYIQAIRIYSLYQKYFSEYELVNPIITSFKHGEHVNGEGGLLEHDMTLQFETVKYLTGYTTPNTVGGYTTLNYDTSPSVISPYAGVNLIDNGQGGATNVPSTITDLATSGVGINPAGAIQATAAAQADLSIYATGPAGGMATATTVNASASVNGGGLSLPGFTSFAQSSAAFQLGAKYGLPPSQNAQLALSSIVNNAQTQIVNGVIKGIAQGAGVSPSIVTLVATAIANPKNAIQTAENLAISYATKAAGAAINTAISTYLVPGISSLVSSTGIGTALTSSWSSFTSFLNPNSTASPFFSIPSSIDLSLPGV